MIKKAWRDICHHFVAFFSVFVLSALALALFCTFEGHVLSQKQARTSYHNQTQLSDVWVYSQGFSKKDLNKVKDLNCVKNAQLRTYIKASTPDFSNVEVDAFLERENQVNTPYLISGEKFNAKDKDGIWIANAFAKRRNLHVGDSFTISYNGISFKKTIKGLIESSEYEYRQAEHDADTYLENIAIVYMSYDGFPVREYVNHLIDQEKITSSDIDQRYANIPLKQLVKQMSDKQLFSYMPYTQMVIQTKDKKGLAHEKAIKKALGKDYSVMVDQDSIPGLARLNAELDQHEAFSYLFVVIFVGISLLVIATTMSRIANQQRIDIGTLNALGMKRYKIILHYMSFSVGVTILGVLLGIFIGTKYLCPILIDMFKNYYVVPNLSSSFHMEYVYIGALVILCSMLSSYISIYKILKLSPSQALRPKTQKAGKKILFEKLSLWNKLSFDTQYNLRDICRSKLRSFMVVLGCAVGMLLMIYGVGCMTMVQDLEDITFKYSQPAKYQVQLSSDISKQEMKNLSQKLDGELVMMDSIEISKYKDPSLSQKKKQSLTVLEGKHLYNVLSLDNKVENLKTGTIGVSRKLSEDLNIHVGDQVYWHLYSKNTWHSARVGVIYRNNETQGIAYLKSDYEKLNEDYAPSILMTNKDPKKYKNLSYVESINTKKAMKKAFESSMEVVNILVYMMILFSMILIVVVLYNSSSLSFHERIKEFATLKVLGFRSSHIKSIINKQNIVLSCIGILIGIPFGNMSLNAMMNSNGENFDYALQIPVINYVISGVLVLLVSILVGFLFSKRIKNLDMVEALKANE